MFDLWENESVSLESGGFMVDEIEYNDFDDFIDTWSTND